MNFQGKKNESIFPQVINCSFKVSMERLQGLFLDLQHCSFICDLHQASDFAIQTKASSGDFKFNNDFVLVFPTETTKP